MDGGARGAVVHWVAKGWTGLSDFTFTFHFHALEKEMATHSSVLAWRIPESGAPGGQRSMGSHRVRHNCSDLAVAAAKKLLYKSYSTNYEDHKDIYIERYIFGDPFIYIYKIHIVLYIIKYNMYEFQYIL